MPCGCQNACGCIVIGGDETIDVTQEGNTFSVFANLFIDSIDDTDCVDLSVDPDGTLTADLILADAADQDSSIQLECSEDGLTGDVVIDPASTAPVYLTSDGLRVDLPPPTPTVDSAQPGDYLFYSGVGARTGYIDADGQPVPRATYPDLHDAISLYTETASRTALSPTITLIPSTRFISPGMPLEATGFPFGTTVLSVDSSTQITASANAVSSGLDTVVRVYPHGNGDGVSTFNVPDTNDRVSRGYDYLSVGPKPMGSTGGSDTATLGVANLAAHVHTATIDDPGHDHDAVPVPGSFMHTHTFTTDAAGTHSHPGSNDGAGGPARNFIMANLSGLTSYGIDTAGADVINVQAGDPDSPGIPTQLNNASTGSAGSHVHTGTSDLGGVAPDVDILDNVTGVTLLGGATDSTGSGDPFDVADRYIVGRWMVHV